MINLIKVLFFNNSRPFDNIDYRIILLLIFFIMSIIPQFAPPAVCSVSEAASW